MIQARLKPAFYNTCAAAYISNGDRISTWSGGKTNLPVRCSIKNGVVYRVNINERWWTVDPTEWEVVSGE